MEIFKYGEKETEWLKSRDSILGAAIDKIGKIERAVIPDLFTALVNSIVGQQISTKAHETVWQRLNDRFSPITPSNLDKITAEQLQACGMTMRKAVYIKNITTAVLNGSLDLNHIQTLPDPDVCAELIKLNGVGKWTAEMLMIFSMQRPNILSYGDLAIHRGLQTLYGIPTISAAQFNEFWKIYSPYATTASLYLWAIAGGAGVGCS